MAASVRSAVERGMAAQLERLRAAVAAGTPRLGWKIAVNDPDVQRAIGLDGPLVAALDGAARIASGGTYRAPCGAALAAEAEIAIEIGRDLAGNVTVEEARAAIASSAPAIEIVDRARPAGDLSALLAHSVFHAATVIGTSQPGLAAVPPAWPRLTVAGQPPVPADPKLVPQDLAAVVAHAARTLARHGERLAAGDRVISGSFVQPVPVVAGDRIDVDFGPLGIVAVHVASREDAS
jgi:2-oxo-hept-3-ene-1,7-dioate hydratase